MSIYNPPPFLRFGDATLDFGPPPGNPEASVVVTGQTLITANSKIQVWISGDDASVDHTAEDHRYVKLFLSLCADAVVPGTGFTIKAISSEDLEGTFTVHYSWI